MRPKELAQRIAKLLTEAEGTFSANVEKVQQQLYRRIFAVLKDLKLDSEGYILQNADNRAILREAENVFDSVIRSSGYSSAIEDQMRVVGKIDELNQKYFETVSTFFKPNRNYIKSLQNQVIRDVNTYLLNDGLIANVKLPLNQILTQNINTGGSFSGFQDQLKNFITGTEGKEGRLLRYSKTYLSDTLFTYARSYQEAVTSDLDLEFYYYSGPVTSAGQNSSGSRDFCRDRMDQYFHRKEIESWADLDWKGKNPATTKSSIFVLLGGYNCKHSLIPVSKIVVPKEAIERAIELGFYQQAA